MTDPPRHLFVYGTLMSAIGHPAHRMLWNGAALVGTATIPGRLYDSGAGYPAAVAGHDGGGRIAGELYLLRSGRDSVVLARLDRYENFIPDRPHDSLFSRVVVEARTPAGERMPAWTYLYNHSTDRLARIPGGDYAAHLARMG